MGRYRAHDPNLCDTPPKWTQDWEPPQDHGLGSDIYDKYFETPNGPKFDQEYLSWWIGVRLEPLGLYRLERLAKVTKGEAKEEGEEE